jgi:hypothetical protein
MLLCALAVLGIVALSGCAGMPRAPVVPGYAWLYADYTSPLDTDVEMTKYSMKKGEASTENILGWIMTGDASIQEAASNGGIKEIRYMDYKFKNILGIYAKFTTIVYGE